MNSIVKPISEGEVGTAFIQDSKDQIRMSQMITDNILAQFNRTPEQHAQAFENVYNQHKEAQKSGNYFKGRVDLMAAPVRHSVSSGNGKKPNGKKNVKR